MSAIVQLVSFATPCNRTPFNPSARDEYLRLERAASEAARAAGLAPPPAPPVEQGHLRLGETGQQWQAEVGHAPVLSLPGQWFDSWQGLAAAADPQARGSQAGRDEAVAARGRLDAEVAALLAERPRDRGGLGPWAARCAAAVREDTRLSASGAWRSLTAHSTKLALPLAEAAADCGAPGLTLEQSARLVAGAHARVANNLHVLALAESLREWAQAAEPPPAKARR